MSDQNLALGAAQADEILAQRKVARARRAAALAAHPAPLELNVRIASAAIPMAVTTRQTAGFLLAVGDSWFDYPFHDVLKDLDDIYGYNVESAAHRGDPIESIAYQGGQLDKFVRGLEKIVSQGATPKAVLISGGGDDIAGAEFGMLLNHANSAISGWNGDILKGLIDDRLLNAYRFTIASVNRVCVNELGHTVPILLHGYDYPVPDGRGFLGGWPFPGPWLAPGFKEKLFDDLATNIKLMSQAIDRFNAMIAQLPAEPAFPNVQVLDLRKTLSNDLTNDAYRTQWANELHPTEAGFEVVTKKFADALAALP